MQADEERQQTRKVKARHRGARSGCPFGRCQAAALVVSLALTGSTCRGDEEFMSTTPGETYYFASWTGYDPPLKPHAPIDYERAEGSAAFTAVVFDAEKRVRSLEKWRATRQAHDPSTLGVQRLAPGVAYLAPDSASPDRPGAAITLEATKPLTDYYRASVAADGSITSLERVHRSRTLRHEYSYWENGGIREARYVTSTQPPAVEHFDRNGKQVVPN